MSDIDIQRIVRALRKIFPQDTRDNLIYGEVKKTEPLEIEIGNGVIITSEFLFLGQMCRPHKVKIPHTHEYNGETEKATSTAGGTIVSPGAITPNPNPTKTTGDLSMSFTGQGVLTVTEFSGHSHKIENQVTEDVHKEGSDYEDYVTIEIEPKLQEGDTVLMFAFNNFQRFYVAERIEKE
jgi:hypothetical protein